MPGVCRWVLVGVVVSSFMQELVLLCHSSIAASTFLVCKGVSSLECQTSGPTCVTHGMACVLCWCCCCRYGGGWHLLLGPVRAREGTSETC